MRSRHSIPAKRPNRLKRTADRDYWLTAIEAKEYGLVDEVLVINPEKREKRKLNLSL